MKKRLLCLPFLILSILGSFGVQASPVRHLRVLMHENPAHEVVIVWSVSNENAKAPSKIYLGKEAYEGNLVKYERVIKITNDELIIDEKDRLVFSKIKDLKPSTRYFFVAEYGNEKTREFYFKTAPLNKKIPFKLLFGGDSRSHRSSRKKMNLEIKSLFEKHPEIVALVHGGDMVANGGNWEQWKSWFSDHQLTTLDDGRVLPIIPTQGNHEVDTGLFNDLFVMKGPNLSRDYYVTKIHDMAIVTLNTNISHAGDQREWLNKTLRELSYSSKWIIPNYHRPAFPAVKRPGGALKHWVPLFEKYQVDLVFESDGHALKRTAPIFKRRIDYKKGITYVGEGGLGVKLRNARKRFKWYFRGSGYAVSKYHVLMLEAFPDRLVYSVNLLGGKVFDTFELKPKTRNPL